MSEPLFYLQDSRSYVGNVSRRHYSRIAYFTEYPEEGSFGLGKELTTNLQGR